jgi:hypothetical protein
LALLRRYEPVLRFTRGERFRPLAVDAFVARASLWETTADGRTTRVVAPGELELDRLASEATRRHDAALFLRFVQRPLGLHDRWRWRRRVRRPRLRRTARLAQVGLVLRLVESLFRLTLWLRGTVLPSGVTAAAEVVVRGVADAPTYYGRVVYDGGYTILQYWFFYAMNDWRSTFHGINDHEGDWEHVCVFLAEDDDGELAPAWVTCSAHDRRGDNMRRRCDDPDLRWEDTHLIVSAAGGSHANYPVPGDYVVTVPIEFLQPVVRFLAWARALLRPVRDPDPVGAMNLPYVDYARGDGDAIGPGTGTDWHACVIGDDTPWVGEFTGLWGVDTRDRLGGERGPGGPRYDRRGAVRASWADPVGWVGLHKVDPTPGASKLALRARVETLDTELAELAADIETRRAALRRESAEIGSLAEHARAAANVAARRAELRRSHEEVEQLHQRATALAEEREMHLATLARPGPVDGPQDHLVQPAHPWIELRSPVAQLRRVWAALSTPLLAVAVAVAITTPRGNLLTFLVSVFAVFVAIEAMLRGRIATFTAAVLVVTGATSLVWGVVVGLLADWPTALAATVGFASLVLLIANVRELRG